MGCHVKYCSASGDVMQMECLENNPNFIGALHMEVACRCFSPDPWSYFTRQFLHLLFADSFPRPSILGYWGWHMRYFIVSRPQYLQRPFLLEALTSTVQ